MIIIVFSINFILYLLLLVNGGSHCIDSGSTILSKAFDAVDCEHNHHQQEQQQQRQQQQPPPPQPLLHFQHYEQQQQNSDSIIGKNYNISRRRMNNVNIQNDAPLVDKRKSKRKV